MLNKQIFIAIHIAAKKTAVQELLFFLIKIFNKIATTRAKLVFLILGNNGF